MKNKLHEELKVNYRKDVFETLELISSKNEQIEYQENVPIAYVSAELFNSWEDCYQIPKSQEWYKDAFSKNEHKILNNFNIVIESICKKTSINPPDILEFIGTPEWSELSKAARKTLVQLSEK